MNNGMTELEEEELAGKRMMLGRVVQNVQIEAGAKGKSIGAVSADQIFEMADRGELDGVKSVESLRHFLRKMGDERR